MVLIEEKKAEIVLSSLGKLILWVAAVVVLILLIFFLKDNLVEVLGKVEDIF